MRGQGPIDDDPLTPYFKQRDERGSYDEVPEPDEEEQEPDEDGDKESREDRSSRFG